jgi:large subunit ribosomal protein L23
VNKFDVLVKPLLSEKSNKVREDQNQYTFRVKLDASKQDVAKAVEAMFSVKVASVRTAITRGKVKRRGSVMSKGSNVKKAVVTLVEGAKIELFTDL